MTFQEWQQQAESSYCAEFGSGGTGNHNVRDVYDMLGQPVFIEVYTPWNVFRPMVTQIKATGFNITKDSETMLLARRHGAEWEEGYYAEDGYGWPVWTQEGPEDRAEECFAFLEEYNARAKGQGREDGR